MQRSTEEGPCDRKGGAFSLRPQRSFVRAEDKVSGGQKHCDERASSGHHRSEVSSPIPTNIQKLCFTQD
jgi:hypothetical protein